MLSPRFPQTQLQLPKEQLRRFHEDDCQVGRNTLTDTQTGDSPPRNVLRMGQFLPFSLSIPLSPEAIDPFCRAFFFSLQVTRSAKTTWDEKTPPFGSWRQLNPCLSPAPLLHFQLSCLLEILATRMPVSWRTQESYAYIVAQALAMSLIQVSRMALKIIGEKKQKKLLDLNISKSSHFYVAECFSFQSLSY